MERPKGGHVPINPSASTDRESPPPAKPDPDRLAKIKQVHASTKNK